jgi:hypothetical protein
MREIANRDGYGQIIKGTSSVRATAVVHAIALGAWIAARNRGFL